MENILISTANEFFNFVAKTDLDTMFRGHTKECYKLRPKVGRLHHPDTLINLEKHLIDEFRHRSKPYLEKEPTNPWEWLALAQHYGLPTRLLDWSLNPLVAAYYAVEKEYDENSVIYAFRYKRKNNLFQLNPFEIKEICTFFPAHITERIMAQSSTFTAHPDPEKPLETDSDYNDKLDKIIIMNDFRAELKRILYQLGIHRHSLFLDLNGVAQTVQWIGQEPMAREAASKP